MNSRRIAVAGLFLGLIVLLPLGAAFAKEVVQVTISGPGLADTLVLTDGEPLTTFAELDFGRMLSQPPTELNDTYFEVQVAYGDGSEIFATNVYHYVPAINADHGYLYYADVINGSSDNEGRWFELSDAADRDLRHILREAGVRFGAVGSADCPVDDAA